MKKAGIRGVELTKVRGVALGDVDDQNALCTGLADQLDDPIEHFRLCVVLGKLAVPRPVRRDKVGLEINQQDGSLLSLDAFRDRHHRLCPRLCKKTHHRDYRRHH